MMRWSTIFLLLLLATVCLMSFIILNLNNSIVSVDLLFSEIEINLGFILLIFFLLGFCISIMLEIFYFLSKKQNKDG
ncbi:MAG: hypothetical protein CMG57_09055 [Candidatus Marinimicrobia bacterium]|nr:hypothetical protein [Candidatus Neomarinimicrobiota bacterium]